MRAFFAALFILSLPISQLFAAPDPAVLKETLDFIGGDKLPNSRSHAWTLGPTGARGWAQTGGSGAAGDTKRSRQIYVTEVKANTPASNKLKKDDVIFGIAGKPFESDARVAFAKAISQAETKDGKLALMRFRDGKKSQITIDLTPRPAWSATAPFNCERSKGLLEEGTAALAKRGLERPQITSHINALALLATGDAQFDEILKKHARATVANPLSNQIGLACWHFAFANLFLTEYYLITKDATVLPEIQRLSQELTDGQGPLGTWGHTFMDEESGRLRGYGAINAVGLPVVISLVLARECGANVKGLDDTIALSASFFRRHVGLGSIPYGDGPPSIKYGHDDNGKSSAAALFFSLIGDQAAAKFYTRSAIAAYGLDREQGHTGNFFNMLWSLPAVSLAGPQATGAWMKEFSWYFDLARDPQFRFPYQGYPREKRNSPHSKWNCPGAYLLHFAIPKKNLRILGRGVEPVKLSDAELADTIAAGKTNFKGATPEKLIPALSSWSPIVRHNSTAEMRKRGMAGKADGSFESENPLERAAAIEITKDFNACAQHLNDPSVIVQAAAIKRLKALDKMKGFEAIVGYMAKQEVPNPVLTQAFAGHFFPLSSRAKSVGELLNAPKDREATSIAIRKLLYDEDALVASRIAMGIQFLPKPELRPLLPSLVKGSHRIPLGNVMFANKLQVSCAEVLTALKTKEGMEAAAELLTKDAWGRSGRMPTAARLLLQYKGHAKASLPTLKEGLKDYTKPSKWKTLIEETIEKIEAVPKASDKLLTVKEI